MMVNGKGTKLKERDLKRFGDLYSPFISDRLLDLFRLLRRETIRVDLPTDLRVRRY